MSKRNMWTTAAFFCVFCVVTAIASPAKDEQPSSSSVTFTSLFSFNGTDGYYP